MNTNKIKEDIIQLSITQSKLECKLEKITNEKDDLGFEYGEYLIHKNMKFIKKYWLDENIMFEHKVYKNDGFWYLHLKGFKNHKSVKFTVLEDDTLELYCYWENSTVKIIGRKNLKNVYENNILTLEKYGFKKDSSTYYLSDYKRKWYLLVTNDSNIIEFLILEDGSLKLYTHTKDGKVIVKNGEKYEE